MGLKDARRAGATPGSVGARLTSGMRGPAGSQSLCPLGRARAASAVTRMETPQPARPLPGTRPSGGLPTQGRIPGGSASAPAPRRFSRPPAARAHQAAELNARPHGDRQEATATPRPEPTRACAQSPTPRAGGPGEARPVVGGACGARPAPRPRNIPLTRRSPFPAHLTPASPHPRPRPLPL